MKMEEGCLEFKAELLTLKEMSVIAIASHLWDLPDIRQEIRNFLEKYYSHSDERIAAKYLYRMSFEIPEMVSETVSRLHLPKVLKSKIKNKVWEMGEKTFNWIMYLTCDLNLDVKYTGKIYWTSWGSIDEDKIFKSWMDFPVEDIIPRPGDFPCDREWFYEKFNPLHFLACAFAQEEFIMNFQGDIVKKYTIIPSGFENSDIVLNIMSTVLCCFWGCKLGRSYYWLEKDVMKLTSAKKLNICVDCCFHRAFVYFWNRADATEQCNYLERHSKMSLEPSCDLEFEYGRENLFHIALFLMSKMNVPQTDDFILENSKLIFPEFVRKKSFQMFPFPLLDKYFSRYIGDAYWDPQICSNFGFK